MNIIEMISWFDIIQDKQNSPYFTSAEKTQFIQRAQVKYVNELIFQHLFPSSRKSEGAARVYSSIEATVAGSEVLEPLLMVDIPVSSDALGVITRASIESALQLISGDTKGYVAISTLAMDLGNQSFLPVRFVRHNDYFKFQNNVFKKASASQPQYRIERETIKVAPTGVFDYLISVVKEPIDVVYDEATPANNVDCELPEFTHDDILAIALDDAGVSSRDSALLQLKQLSDKNLTTLA